MDMDRCGPGLFPRAPERTGVVQLVASARGLVLLALLSGAVLQSCGYL